jgi:predicted metal-dependent hydrolase
MSTLYDDEFGEVAIRRNPKSRKVTIRVAPDGSLKASLPKYAPLFSIKMLIRNSRDELRRLIRKAQPEQQYYHGMPIGKSHYLFIQTTSSDTATITTDHSHINLQLPSSSSLGDPAVVRLIRDQANKCLRKEAKLYLPKRLSQLAALGGFSYQNVRFSHASSRWGSCSSRGTVSLNIALMKLPHELIDYVLIHELSHTKHMNHSREFWQTVASIDPDYKKHRLLIKSHNPSI